MKNKKLLGIFFIIVGLLIAITPFTPGSVLLIVGLDMVFGDRWPWLKRINNQVIDLGKRFLNFIGLKKNSSKS